MTATRRRKRGARFVEIAEAAEVSTATVNRVLNEHGSVSPATRARVVAAAKRLGVPRLLPDPRHGLTRLDVVLARSPTPFFRRIELALQRTIPLLDRRIVVHRHVVDEQDDAEIADALGRSRQRRDGLLVAVPDTAAVRAALGEVIARGTPVVTLMSDIGDVPRLHYVGIDNVRAGRTAAHFIGRLAVGRLAIGQPAAGHLAAGHLAAGHLAAGHKAGPGRVLVLANSLAYRAHRDRTRACAEALAERFPQLVPLAPVECFDDADRAYQAVRRALAAPRAAPLVGLYHSGAGSAGIAAALERAGRAGDLVWVGHELSDEHRDYLARGTMDLAIDQDADRQVSAGMQHLLHACGYLEEAPPAGTTEFRLFCAENLPAQGYLR